MTFFLFISAGWVHIKSKFSKGEVSKIMISACIFYLSLSSYQIGYEISLIGLLALVVLLCTYIWIFALILYNSIKNILLLNAHLNFIVITDVTLEKSLRLKWWIISDFLALSIFYTIFGFSFLVTFHVVQNVNSSFIIYTVYTFINFFLCFCMLFIFRAWRVPQLFNLEVRRDV